MRRDRRIFLAVCAALAVAQACTTFSGGDDAAPVTPDASDDAADDRSSPPAVVSPISGDAGPDGAISCEGGVPPTTSVVFAPAPIDRITTDGLFVYWTSLIANHAARAKVDGGQLDILVSDAGGPTALALTANDVYFITSQKLVFVPKTGQVPPTLVGNATQVSTLATSSDHAFVGLVGGIRTTMQGTATANDIRIALDEPQAIAVANGRLAYIVAEPDNTTKNGVYEGPAGAQVNDALLVDDVGTSSIVATDGKTVFFVKNGNDIMQAATPARIVAHEDQPIGALVVDETAIFYSTAAGVKYLDRVRDCTVVVSTTPSITLAMTPAELYFLTTSTTIVRMKR
jgi:hypothetical protein